MISSVARERRNHIFVIHSSSTLYLLWEAFGHFLYLVTIGTAIVVREI
jgi:hypothetical protein